MKTFLTLLKVEGKLSLRDMNMVLFAVIMPLVTLILIGIIYQGKPAFTGADYSFVEQSFGALCTIAICAGGLMGLPMLISDYRERKILKRFKSTPISQSMTLLVHLGIYSLYSIISVITLWITAGLFLGFKMRGSILIFFAGWLLVLVSILSIGMFVGGIAKNSKHASVIACILYFPMLIFSGATLPYEAMPGGLQHVADLMPLTQGIKVLKAASLGLPIQDAAASIMVMAAVAVIFVLLSIKCFRWE
ncbi:MAG: ABC transporter permease [bacterium]|nr:ABC transporter permease [bacterium]